MRQTNFIKTMPLLAIIAFLGFAVQASADGGMGYGHYHGWAPPMHGMHHGSYGEPGFGYGKRLSAEDVQKLEKERLAFFEATQDLRSKMYQKRLELRSELAKKNPDTKKAAGLQGEISKLKAEFDQEHLNHFFKMRKINPDMGRGFGGGRGMMGPGMMGRGCYGIGHGMTGPGMMGPGMMGPGMMGSGMMGRGGYGMGRGMMGASDDYVQRYGGHMESLEEKDARNIVENYIRSTRNPNLKIGKIVDSGNAYRAQITTQENSLVEEVLIDKANGSMRSAY
jgi:Spy/CpxP family protein refolding chaperone